MVHTGTTGCRRVREFLGGCRRIQEGVKGHRRVKYHTVGPRNIKHLHGSDRMDPRSNFCRCSASVCRGASVSGYGKCFLVYNCIMDAEHSGTGIELIESANKWR